MTITELDQSTLKAVRGTLRGMISTPPEQSPLALPDPTSSLVRVMEATLKEFNFTFGTENFRSILGTTIFNKPGTHRRIVYQEDLSDLQKLTLLLHSIGHISCRHHISLIKSSRDLNGKGSAIVELKKPLTQIDKSPEDKNLSLVILQEIQADRWIEHLIEKLNSTAHPNNPFLECLLASFEERKRHQEEGTLVA